MAVWTPYLGRVVRPRSLPGRAREAHRRLAVCYPGSVADLCELAFESPFQLLAATVLSAQTTDIRVNSVTPALFARYPTPADLACAEPGELEEIIHQTGFFRAKARSLIGLGRELDERFDGTVPTAMGDLVSLPGVGRKTANVIRSVAFDLPGLAVDTHVARLTKLLGLTQSTDPVRIESDVCALLPPRDWGSFGLTLILHGRRVCIARRPRCADCALADICPSASLPTHKAAVTRKTALTGKSESARKEPAEFSARSSGRGGAEPHEAPVPPRKAPTRGRSDPENQARQRSR